MKYASEDGSVIEWLWNSRDGVTPFCLTAQDGKTELLHVQWELDRVSTNYQPLPGERIFIDYTEKKAREYITKQIEQFWEDERTPMKEYYPDKETAFNSLLKSHLEDVRNGSPMVIFARDWKDPRQKGRRGPIERDGSPKTRFA